jgi:LuxR family maltose regulon positive regulatory protein
VLQHLPSHLSNAEIAARLLVATTTVKTQVSSIYRKLGVRKRSQAVDVARGLQLLDDQPHRRAVEDR